MFRVVKRGEFTIQLGIFSHVAGLEAHRKGYIIGIPASPVRVAVRIEPSFKEDRLFECPYYDKNRINLTAQMR